MKRKFFSLIIALFLFASTFFISACSKGGGYNLKNLSEDFYSIASEENDNIVKNGNDIVFYYSNHVQDGKTFVTNAINSVAMYQNLKNYNLIYENILKFTFEYIDVCSNNEVEIDKDVKNSLEEKMKNLHASIKDVDVCTDFFAGILKTTEESKRGTDPDCLLRFENLLLSYENLFESATSFNIELSNIYYNHILTNSNPNVEEIEPANFDSSIVINKLDARICWQISNLSSVFAEQYIIDSTAASDIKNGSNLNLNPTGFEYFNLVESINVEINEDTAVQNVNSSNKLAFYGLCTQAYKAQSLIDINKSNFLYACNTIKYAQLASDLTAKEEMCINIINDYGSILKEYNNLLIEMLNKLEV